ncbi:hypothetical protein K505DRAFT_370963 [Melanomma pulvis-pyrius CBS 109.77]|uniref:Uncharacterized protein n=1 Tax=Melanomma pulvis-pyrius CBS 109.77 TaxID=1314802 RepID=A0A6A6XUK2_9PLEO|nr:hypothetical protein K505DRAFT_370963 [Melanomma pulvis-pyrius CBS 109.77]
MNLGLGAINRPRPTSFEKLDDDVLHLVFEQVFLVNPADLPHTCLVSRKFYLLSVPWLYRNVKIDFSRHAHRHLLLRLLREDSRLPAKIRELDLNNADAAALLDLYSVFSRLTNLKSLTWTGSIQIPLFVLKIVSTKFPRAQISIKATQGYHNWRGNVAILDPVIPVNVLRHVASRQLTSFTLCPSHKGKYYEDFKLDLVLMLIHNPALTRFEIRDIFNGSGSQTFADMLPIMRGSPLPQPKNFTLLTALDIFTTQELTLWGNKKGWNNLEELEMYDAQYLLGFIGQIPRLVTLWIPAETAWDPNDIEACLCNHNTKSSPLGTIRCIEFRARPINSDDLIPWPILRRISRTITYLNVARYSYGEQAPTIPAPNAENIRALRHMCPRLDHLFLDITIEKETWPFALLSELALFGGPMILTLYLHQPNQENLWHFVTSYNCRKAFHHMVEARRLSNRSVNNSFKVDFKIVRPWKEMEGLFYSPDFSFWKNSSGYTKSKSLLTLRKIKKPDPQEFHNVTIAELEKRSRLQLFKGLRHKSQSLVKYYAGGRTAVCDQELQLQRREWIINRKAMEKEMCLRKSRARAEATFGSDATLFDMWA